MIAEVVGSIVGYWVIGSLTAAYCRRFEKHGRDCQLCWWEGTGFIWPLYWLWRVAVFPYRTGKWYFERPRLPRAKLLKEDR